MEEKISKKKLRNFKPSTNKTAEDIFRVMEKKYGNKSTIVIEICAGEDSTCEGKPAKESH